MAKIPAVSGIDLYTDLNHEYYEKDGDIINSHSHTSSWTSFVNVGIILWKKLTSDVVVFYTKCYLFPQVIISLEHKLRTLKF